jgi:hypothetical protein
VFIADIHPPLTMTKRPGMGKIIFITRPSRKRENLQVLLKSAGELPEIPCVEDFEQAIDFIPYHGAVLAIVDHNIPLAEISSGMQHIRTKNPYVACVLMITHPLQKKDFLPLPPDGWIYEDFSFDDIRRLLTISDRDENNNIHTKKE